jgi:hypothetical protein
MTPIQPQQCCSHSTEFPRINILTKKKKNHMSQNGLMHLIFFHLQKLSEMSGNKKGLILLILFSFLA